MGHPAAQCARILNSDGMGIDEGVILAGGYGTRLSEEIAVVPKPMVWFSGKPIACGTSCTLYGPRYRSTHDLLRLPGRRTQGVPSQLPLLGVRSRRRPREREVIAHRDSRAVGGVLHLAADGDALFASVGCAHRHQALSAHARALYRVSGSYTPELERGSRQADSMVSIDWALSPTRFKGEDQQLPTLGETELRRTQYP